MPTSVRASLVIAILTLACGPAACNAVPRNLLHQSQVRSSQLYQQNQSLAAQNQQANQMAQAIAAEKQRLAQENSSLRNSLDVANQRLENLNAERSQLQDRYASLLNQAKNQPSPLPGSATRRFEELARKYPDFEFDPLTGVSKFHSDILFESGSAELKSSAEPILREFANIMNAADAHRLNILVVGHTDDKPIGKASTRAKHPTNWHLSTNRANSVVLQLGKYGLKDARMGAAGYSMFQPLVPNNNESTRSQNRRVEIFVLAPDAVVAGWDPADQRE